MHGERAKRRGNLGRDYWKARPFAGSPYPRKAHRDPLSVKTLTHRVERRVAKRELEKGSVTP